jgi:hypothetical protein
MVAEVLTQAAKKFRRLRRGSFDLKCWPAFKFLQLVAFGFPQKAAEMSAGFLSDDGRSSRG